MIQCKFVVHFSFVLKYLSSFYCNHFTEGMLSSTEIRLLCTVMLDWYVNSKGVLKSIWWFSKFARAGAMLQKDSLRLCVGSHGLHVVIWWLSRFARGYVLLRKVIWVGVMIIKVCLNWWGDSQGLLEMIW